MPLTPNTLVEVEVDVTDFTAQGQILVDLVLGVKVDFPSLVGRGQVQLPTTLTGRRSEALASLFP